MNRKDLLHVVLMAVTGYVLMAALQPARTGQAPTALAYSELLAAVRSGEVRQVRIEGQRLSGEREDGRPFTTYVPDDPGLVGDLLDAGVAIEAVPPPRPSALGRILTAILPLLLLLGVFVFLIRRQLGSGQGIFGIGRSTARQVDGARVSARLGDVAGVDEAKEEVGELVEFLRDPDRFRRLGGTIPRGVLMVGSPGTGKTLLARAIAGEAGVPFFTVSGSDFVEMFVGVGASRVRDLFEQAKKSAPCIVFVDEIDAVGRRRGAGLGGGHDEREQTLNQLLVEMDGFEGTEGVIVVAATNRPDVLDPALLRPGRFDRQVVVPLPDLLGRAAILEVHMRKVPVAEDADAMVLARGTAGFSGADLANLVNEAALFAARADHRRVDMDDFERAKDKILMGTERRSMVMSDEERLITAYHEAGHALVGKLVPEHDPIHKVSIIPRGRALGVTLFLPEQDRHSATRRRLESQIATLFGGRVAEHTIFGADAVTTGASNDLERATQIARNMVTRWGFSGRLGPLAYDDGEGEVFLGRTVAEHKPVSDGTARVIDAEVREIIERNYARASRLIGEHRETLERLAAALVAHETLTGEQVDQIIEGADLAGQPPDAPPPPGAGQSQPRGPRPSSPPIGPALGQH